MISRQIYKKVGEICSIILLGYRFFAPCDPVDYLSYEYGTDVLNWLEPKTSGYEMSNLYRASDWTQQEWFETFRWYHPDGSLNCYSTLDYLNTYNPFKKSKASNETHIIAECAPFIVLKNFVFKTVVACLLIVVVLVLSFYLTKLYFIRYRFTKLRFTKTFF